MASCRALVLRSMLLPDPLHHLNLRAAASAPAAARSTPPRRRRRHLRCCSSSNSGGGGGGGGDPGQPPQEAVLEAISKVARSKGRVALTTNMVLGGTVADDSGDEWLVLDQKGRVSQKLSSRGKYVSVKIGPIRVVSSEQVQAVYRAMRRDNRMKYFL